MSTFAWSYKSDVSGNKPPKEHVGKIEQWQRKRHAESTLSGKTGNSFDAVKNGGTTGKKPKYDIRARLYVGNLDWETTEVELAHYFSVFGDLEDVKIIKDHKTGNSRGFAFITFTKASVAEEAKRWCSYNYPMLRGRDISVTSAERRLPRQRKSAATSHDNSADLSSSPKDINSTLFWEYKWTQEVNAETFGPFDTSAMLRWVKQGYFECGCWVRQVDVTKTMKGFISNENLHVDDKETEGGGITNKPLIDYSDSSDSEDEHSSQNKVGISRERVQDRQEGEEAGEEGVQDEEGEAKKEEHGSHEGEKETKGWTQDIRKKCKPESDCGQAENEIELTKKYIVKDSSVSDENNILLKEAEERIHGDVVNYGVDKEGIEKEEVKQGEGYFSHDKASLVEENVEKVDGYEAGEEVDKEVMEGEAVQQEEDDSVPYEDWSCLEGNEEWMEREQDESSEDYENDRGEGDLSDTGHHESWDMSDFVHISEINFAMFP